LLEVFEESADWALLSSFCSDSKLNVLNFHISVLK